MTAAIAGIEDDWYRIGSYLHPAVTDLMSDERRGRALHSRMLRQARCEADGVHGSLDDIRAVLSRSLLSGRRLAAYAPNDLLNLAQTIRQDRVLLSPAPGAERTRTITRALEACWADTRAMRAALNRTGHRERDPAARLCIKYADKAVAHIKSARADLLSAVSRAADIRAAAGRAAVSMRDASRCMPLEQADAWNGLPERDVALKSDTCTYLLTRPHNPQNHWLGCPWAAAAHAASEHLRYTAHLITLHPSPTASWVCWVDSEIGQLVQKSAALSRRAQRMLESVADRGDAAGAWE